MATAAQHVASLASLNHAVASAGWRRLRTLTRPQKIQWCEGSEAEYQALKRELIAAKELLPLNRSTFPAACCRARILRTWRASST